MTNHSYTASGRTTILIHSFRLSLLFGAVLATSASADSILIDDFNDGNDDGWMHIDSTVGRSWGPGVFQVEGHDADKEYRLQGSGFVPLTEDGAFLASQWEASSDPIYSHGFVRARLRTDEEDTFAAVVMRTSGSRRALQSNAPQSTPTPHPQKARFGSGAVAAQRRNARPQAKRSTRFTWLTS